LAGLVIWQTRQLELTRKESRKVELQMLDRLLEKAGSTPLQLEERLPAHIEPPKRKPARLVFNIADPQAGHDIMNLPTGKNG
jgi:hypothetical protein